MQPRKHPSKPTANNPAILAVVKKGNCGAEGSFGHRAVEGKGLAKSTLEASGFSQPDGQRSKSSNLDVCPSSSL